MCASKVNDRYYLNNDDKSVVEVDLEYVEKHVLVVAMLTEST
jgi:hypothetical protein